MPNHVMNVLTFTGGEDAVRQALEGIRNEEYGVGTIDFNKLIPMPPDLRIESGSRTHRGLVAYRSFLDARAGGPDGTPLSPEEVPAAEEEAFLKGRPDVSRADFALGKRAWSNLKRYGSATWYGWSYDHWGTKWNAYGYDALPASDLGEGRIWFRTAWAEPRPVLEELARRYPSVAIRHEWADEYLGHNCGRRVYENGREDEDRAYCPDPEEDGFRFAVSVWSHDMRNRGMAPSRDGSRLVRSDEEFERVEILGQPALFTRDRLSDRDVPENLSLCYLRAAEDGEGYEALEPSVPSRHGGSLVTREPLDFYRGRPIPLDAGSGPRFLGQTGTFAELAAGADPRPNPAPSLG